MANPNPRGHRIDPGMFVDLGRVIFVARTPMTTVNTGAMTHLYLRGVAERVNVDLTDEQHEELLEKLEIYRSKR